MEIYRINININTQIRFQYLVDDYGKMNYVVNYTMRSLGLNLRKVARKLYWVRPDQSSVQFKFPFSYPFINVTRVID